MPWLTPTREPTLAELLSQSSISGGGGISSSLLQQPPNQWLEALKQVAPAITNYIQKKKSDDIANQLLRDTGAPQQYQDRGAIGLQAWNQLHQFRENQPDTAMDDLDYQIKYRQANPEEFPDQPYYGRGGNPRYPVQLPDGRTVYVTGNEALDYYNGAAGGQRKPDRMSEVPSVPESVYKNSMKNRPFSPGPAFQNYMAAAGAAQPEPPASSETIPTVTTKEERDALPSGAVYIGPDGKKHRKP